jgi:hypothetical protein
MSMARDGRFGKRGVRDWPQVLQQLITPEIWRSFNARTPSGGHADKHWTAKYVVLCWALMGWVGLPGLSQRFEQGRATLAVLWPSRRRPGRTIQGLMKAGRRLTARVFALFWSCLRERVAQRLGAAWRWHDWIVMAVDGSRIETPRTRANEKKLGCAGRDKTGPQWFVTTRIHLPSRLLWSWRQGDGKSSERGHLRQIHLKRRGKSIYLLTNVLETTRLPARLAGELYAARWGVEVNFRGLKQTLERRRLLARTPDIGALELAGNLVALGLLLAQAAWLLRLKADRAGVAAWLRLLRRTIAALVHRRRTSWFVRLARTALRDDYPRRRSKRARDWPHKKHDSPPKAPKLRRMTRREKKAIQRYEQHTERSIG